ncbi:UDP-D-xylose:ribitol-5-phosphate beta1,4-xylosyltransferase-like [Lingula anatina]|uniref:UDP-D-xylose:ribitol-5-phosphate beta1,4-xylosyltransferase-like n=1 Tax=Lingula anatina TaxID=7574 RepID=A0A1S3ITG1_LINAN|nr:UDP-D-xylose:ribitol-5-phosphate beta1,4-xylosyltransferase-like [Lingula anatina]|eukprot:XP_013401373.1 UDP-D-xylose:ribitol-5-phosphate beta1,4-xylosyltransferase-like [Lingula anatina]
MRCSLKKLAQGIFCIYVAFTCYTTYIWLQKTLRKAENTAFQNGIKFALSGTRLSAKSKEENWNPWGEEFEDEKGGQRRPPFQAPVFSLSDVEKQALHGNSRHGSMLPWRQLELGAVKKLPSQKIHNIELWGKAAIGLYLWEHIMNSTLEDRLGGVWQYGSKRIQNLIFRFRTGPGVVPHKAPKDVENLVLVLNGREQSKIDFAKIWLDSLSTFEKLKNVAVILLGNEQCDNEWIKQYLVQNGGLVKLVFLVYDSPDVDNVNFYQWPLGVATYRGFPKFRDTIINAMKPRQYICNFLGTVYPNSSRETLMKILTAHNMGNLCYLRPRYEWLPLESEDTRQDFIQALKTSDVTLNPVGKNTECYRIYEALSMGSVPVVEDVMTPGNCGKSKVSHNAPLQLLKEYGAPVIYVKKWEELPDILKAEQKMSISKVIERRTRVLNWYKEFLLKTEEYFVGILKDRFFSS